MLKRAVALKILHPALTVDPQFLARFQIEAELAAQMDHPNIVPIYDFNQIDGRYVITMGLMARGSLKDHLASYGAMNVHQSKTMLEQVASGLAYAHERDVIHRDLKPGNILIDAQGVARISDFGFAKARSADSLSLSMAGSLLGTPSYMAPEIWEGKPASPRSDIYSLGCIAHEMLTGSQLFQGETPVQVMHAHIVRGPKPLEGLPSVWQSFIDKCLEPESENRYTTVNALLEDLKWGLFDAPQEREREIVLGGLEDEQASAEGIYAGETDGAAHEEELTIELSSAEDLGEDAEPALEDTRVEDFMEDEPKDPAQEDHPTTGKRQKVSRLALGVAAVLWAVVLMIVLFKSTSTSVTKVRSKDRMAMVYVPEGKFTMGSNESDSKWDNERPEHEVHLNSYWIDKYEVSNAQYGMCVRDGSCTIPKNPSFSSTGQYEGFARNNHFPVVYVNWEQAKTYCEWVGGSLPTEAQWEKAARGTDGRKYPWGNESPSCDKANYNPAFSRACKGNTSEVGSYPAGVSPYGAMDMAGNVWEWVLDWYGFYNEAEKDNPQGPGTGDNRVARGGSWYFNYRSIRSASRRYVSPTYTYDDFGFRCVLPQP